jgi:hypothetical protein
VPAASYQYDFDARRMCPTQRREVVFRNLEVRIEQRTVNIEG